jgi:hypothetical protein
MARSLQGIPETAEDSEIQAGDIGDHDVHDPSIFQNAVDLLKGLHRMMKMFQNGSQGNHIKEPLRKRHVLDLTVKHGEAQASGSLHSFGTNIDPIRVPT